MSVLQVIQGDITQCEVDVIVNAANTSLLGGGGVDGAIHRAAGPELLEECKSLGGCTTGMAKMTQGYRLLAKHVIHTVGPVWNGGKKNEKDLLKSCYTQALALATKNALHSIAFPCISTGVYRFPKEEASKIAVSATRNFVQENSQIKKVLFICFNNDDFQLYQKHIS